LASLVLRPVAVLALPGGPHPTESAMSYFGGMDQEKDQKLAWKGKATDPKVQAMRDKLEKERLAEDAEAEKRLKAENKAYMAMIAAEGAAEDDDIMDEEAGRQRLVMAKKSKEFYKEEKSALQHANLDNRRRLKNVKSKIHSYNDQWNAKIDKRHQEEAQIEALLMEIRDRVQGGTVDDDREGMHALEKQLAKAQHWVVAPPTADAPMFKYNAPPTAFLESMLSAVHQPTQYWDAQYDASPEAGAQNGWEQKDLVHLQFGSPDSVTDAFGRPLVLK